MAATVLVSTPAFGQFTEFRSIDGTGNNIASPNVGSAGVTLLRLAPHAYLTGGETMASGPNARMISNAVCDQAGGVPSLAGVTDFVWQWGQFVDHDIDLTVGAMMFDPMDITVDESDPWFMGVAIGFQRSNFIKAGASAPREQINDVTAFIDASNVYGSDLPGHWRCAQTTVRASS